MGSGGLRQPAQQDDARSSRTARRSGTSRASSGCSATGTVDVVGIDPGRAEGITGFKRAVERIEFYRRQANAHCWSSAIVTAASLAMSFSSPAFKLIEVKPLRNPMQHELVPEPIEHVDGWFYPPTKPGLGIDVSEDVVDRYRSEKVLAAADARPSATAGTRRIEMTWSVGAGLEGRGVILTGAAGGIGAAVAEAFASDRGEGHGRGPGPGATRRGRRRRSRAAGTSAAVADLRDLATHDALVPAGRATSSAACTCSPTWPPSCVAAARSTR